jgi:hypothetical protein
MVDLLRKCARDIEIRELRAEVKKGKAETETLTKEVAELQHSTIAESEKRSKELNFLSNRILKDQAHGFSAVADGVTGSADQTTKELTVISDLVIQWGKENENKAQSVLGALMSTCSTDPKPPASLLCAISDQIKRVPTDCPKPTCPTPTCPQPACPTPTCPSPTCPQPSCPQLSCPQCPACNCG